MSCVGRCSIYKDRPQFCRDYPKITDMVPTGCTHHFVGSERRGECQPEVCQESSCCSYPREGGEPEAKTLDHLAGGLPCKHLQWEESPLVKVASADVLISSTSEVVGKITELLREI